jgi:putative effector of murein hydrolase LrgA (UPF0299 family)
MASRSDKTEDLLVLAMELLPSIDVLADLVDIWRDGVFTGIAPDISISATIVGMAFLFFIVDILHRVLPRPIMGLLFNFVFICLGIVPIALNHATALAVAGLTGVSLLFVVRLRIEIGRHRTGSGDTGDSVEAPEPPDPAKMPVDVESPSN